MKIKSNYRDIHYTYSSVSGNYPFRLEKTICFESTLERDFITLMEFNPLVLDLTEQPITFEYKNFNNRKASYTPDFKVDFSADTSLPSSYIVEVKPRKFIKSNWDKLREKFKLATKYARENGYTFKIYDEGKIRSQYLDNIKLINSRKYIEYPLEEEIRILEHLSASGHLPIDEILEYLYVTREQKGIALGHILSLIAKHQISCNMNLPINRNTIIWSKTEENSNEPAHYR
ncbi:TnsA endonuclease N-terminal domain-containing protein [Francisella philomiragia]|uniref:TnsA endonuclease N-terminal domain-containing protein n=1 Tax=Francisella philomiragia TaxID=28110 RepID=UPI001B8BF691|nr:TnsA endonuclease N-terminal domain-containing protein [Francisella philomiragia]QUE31240.1 TnsA endonuclease N-terminal domain-containing protein [Francisella philomiragia]